LITPVFVRYPFVSSLACSPCWLLASMDENYEEQGQDENLLDFEEDEQDNGVYEGYDQGGEGYEGEGYEGAEAEGDIMEQDELLQGDDGADELLEGLEGACRLCSVT
jgi:hypothetical protein